MPIRGCSYMRNNEANSSRLVLNNLMVEMIRTIIHLPGNSLKEDESGDIFATAFNLEACPWSSQVLDHAGLVGSNAHNETGEYCRASTLIFLTASWMGSYFNPFCLCTTFRLQDEKTRFFRFSPIAASHSCGWDTMPGCSFPGHLPALDWFAFAVYCSCRSVLVVIR